MHSLTVKLTMAFLLIGVAGATLVALLVGVQTRSEFNRFISERDQETLISALTNYYAAHQNWNDVGSYLTGTEPLNYYSRNIELLDANNNRVFGRASNDDEEDEHALQTNITHNGAKVGTVVFYGVDTSYRSGPPGGRGPNDAAGSFLDQVTRASAISALVAALFALFLGVVLARTLTKPIRELTAATRAMADGALDQQVVVRSRDEIGELAVSFNHMSADLARASQLRKQMTADLAHDLRTPLSILRGYTEGLQDGRLAGDTPIYSVMYEEVTHLQRLVEDLRVLSLADAGELSLNRRVVDPTALLERAGLAYIMQAEQHGIALKIEADSNLPSVSVDTDRLAQVLNNLVSNALRHTTAGEIVLGATADDHAVTLTVRDTGVGIASDDLPFIFDRFYRADKARQRIDSTSSGLGLAITRALVEAHGGKISATSTPGMGTTFAVRLPRAGRATLEIPDPNAENLAHQREPAEPIASRR